MATTYEHQVLHNPTVADLDKLGAWGWEVVSVLWNTGEETNAIAAWGTMSRVLLRRTPPRERGE